MVICPECGKSTPDGRFCEHCGGRLQGVPGPAPGTAPLPPPPKPGISALRIVLIGGVTILVILFIIGFIDSLNIDPVPIPVTPTRTMTTAQTGSAHVPYEVISGSVNSGGTYRITTHLRDPTTTSYSIRLAGPKDADLDLYVKRAAEPTTSYYDYHSSGADSNEQVRISPPDLGEYHILVHSVKGGGNFVLYIEYKYS